MVLHTCRRLMAAFILFIKEELSPGCLVNLIDQYYPAHQAHRYREISRQISYEEYQEALEYAKKLGLNLVR